MSNVNIKIMLIIAMHFGLCAIIFYKHEVSNYMDNVNVSYPTVDNVKSYILKMM